MEKIYLKFTASCDISNDLESVFANDGFTLKEAKKSLEGEKFKECNTINVVKVFECCFDNFGICRFAVDIDSRRGDKVPLEGEMFINKLLGIGKKKNKFPIPSQTLLERMYKSQRNYNSKQNRVQVNHHLEPRNGNFAIENADLFKDSLRLLDVSKLIRYEASFYRDGENNDQWSFDALKYLKKIFELVQDSGHIREIVIVTKTHVYEKKYTYFDTYETWFIVKSRILGDGEGF